jgi:hypothetical protein
MQDMIPVSADERRFSPWEWVGFLGAFAFLTFHFIVFTGGMVGAIWRDVWIGDYDKTDLISAVVHTGAALPALVAIYSVFYVSACLDPFTRGSVLIDNRAGRLILTRRHITGFSFRKSLALTDIRDLNVAWTKSEDGKDIPELKLIRTGKPVQPVITNPSDAADLPGFAAKLRAQMAAAGWSKSSSWDVHKV